MTGVPRQHGLSVVELMVGLAIGLVGLACGLKLVAGHVDHSRRLLVQARVHQDLRAASDLIARDLRRAGYRDAPASAPMANPYAQIAWSDGRLTYSYSQDDSENHHVDSRERHGFRLSGTVLQTLHGGAGWQPLNDPASTVVTGFRVTPLTRRVPLGYLCAPECDSDDVACPALVIREYEIVLAGRAAGDASVAREITQLVRVRNDDLPQVACP